MRTLIQKVSRATIRIDQKEERSIGAGLLILLGIEEADGAEDLAWLSGKISRLRVFDDEQGVMNLSVKDIGGELMIVSQFTLHASTKKGNRPSYIKAARPETAVPLYEAFIRQMKEDTNLRTVSGEFGSYMEVSLTNDGPVTIMIDSKIRE